MQNASFELFSCHKGPILKETFELVHPPLYEANEFEPLLHKTPNFKKGLS